MRRLGASLVRFSLCARWMLLWCSLFCGVLLSIPHAFAQDVVNISGSCKQYDEITACADSQTVRVAVNGTLQAETTTTLQGSFTILLVTVTSGDVVTVFLDDVANANEAVAVTKYTGPAIEIAGLLLLEEHLTIGNDENQTLTNTNLSQYDNSVSADEDIFFDVNGGNLWVDALSDSSREELYVVTGNTFAPGGRVFGHDLDVRGTMQMNTSGLTLSGSMLTGTGTFSTGTGIMLKSTATSELLILGSGSTANLTIDNGLLAYWKLDDGKGTKARDSGPYENHMTLQSMEDADWSTTVAPTDYFYNAYSLDFDGSAEYTSVTTVGFPTATRNLTMSAWIRCDALGAFDGIVETRANAIFALLVSGASGNPLTYMWEGGSDEYSGATGLTIPTDGTWMLAAVTISPTAATVYKYAGGTLSSWTNTKTHNVYSINGLWEIARENQSSSRLFDGRIDDVRVYRRTLTASEIETLGKGYPNTGSGVYILGSTLDINGHLAIRSGGIDVTTTNYAITASGNWLNVGAFTPRSGLVQFNRAGQATVSGSTMFYNLTKTTTSATSLYLDFRGRQSVSGALTLRGAASNLLTLASTKGGSGARLVLDAEAGTQTIDYLSVQDMNANGGVALTCYTASEGCTNAGNNANWVFATAYRVSGTVYTDEGSTVIGASKTVAISVNGAASTLSDATDAGGFYTIASVEQSLGDVLTLYLDGAAEDAVTVIVGSGSNMSGVKLYQDRLIVRNGTGGVIDNVHLNTADNNLDADITALYTADSSNNVGLAADKELYVWAGSTYTPRARARSHDVEVKGTMTMGTFGLVVSGSLVTNAGTFTSSTGVLLSARTTSETLSMGSNASFQNLLIDGQKLVAHWKFDDGQSNKARDSTPNLTHLTLTSMEAADWSRTLPPVRFYDAFALDFDGAAEYGSVAASGLPQSTNTVTFTAWIRADTLGSYEGVIHSRSVSAQGMSLSGGTGNPLTYHWENSVDEYNGATGLTVPTDGTWIFGAVVITPTAATVYKVQGGTLSSWTNTKTHNAKTINNTWNIGRDSNGYYFDGHIDDVRIYNLSLNRAEIERLGNGYPDTGSGIYLLGAALDVNGNLRILGGGIDVSGTNYGITLGGNFLNLGGFTKRSGTFTLDGSGEQTISGSTVFHNFTKTVTSASTLYYDHLARQFYSGALTLRGASSNLLSIRSTWIGSGARMSLDLEDGTQTIDYLNVKDNWAQSGATLLCYATSEGCVNSGNNNGWNFTDPPPPPSRRRTFFYFLGD